MQVFLFVLVQGSNKVIIQPGQKYNNWTYLKNIPFNKVYTNVVHIMYIYVGNEMGFNGFNYSLMISNHK